MNINPVDKFRSDFFETVINEEKAKEKAQKLAQKNCFHNFNLRSIVTEAGYQQRTCSKCGLSAIKSVRVWDHAKDCIIS
jgi:hypothetical protein